MGRAARWGSSEGKGGKMRWLMPGLTQLQAYMDAGIWRKHGVDVFTWGRRTMIVAVNSATAA